MKHETTELIERLAREAGFPGQEIMFTFHDELARFAALVAEHCAQIADAEERLRTSAGQANPEGSAARDRCFAGARAATNCAWSIRAAFPMPAAPELTAGPMRADALTVGPPHASKMTSGPWLSGGEKEKP